MVQSPEGASRPENGDIATAIYHDRNTGVNPDFRLRVIGLRKPWKLCRLRNPYGACPGVRLSTRALCAVQFTVSLAVVFSWRTAAYAAELMTQSQPISPPLQLLRNVFTPRTVIASLGIAICQAASVAAFTKVHKRQPLSSLSLSYFLFSIDLKPRYRCILFLSIDQLEWLIF